MLDEVDGPMNFTQMVTLFATKMAGGSDDDDVILASFEAFEQDGKIDAETFRAQLMTFGNKFSASEVDDAFAEFKIDDGQIDAAHLKGLMVSKKIVIQTLKYNWEWVFYLGFHFAYLIHSISLVGDCSFSHESTILKIFFKA